MHIYFFVMLIYTPLSIIVMLIAEYVREFSNVIMRLRDKRKYNEWGQIGDKRNLNPYMREL